MALFFQALVYKQNCCYTLNYLLKITKKNKGVACCGLAIYMIFKKYLKAKEELWKL